MWSTVYYNIKEFLTKQHHCLIIKKHFSIMSKERRKNIVQNMFKSICIASLMLGYMFALTSCEKEKDGLEFIPYDQVLVQLPPEETIK